MMEISNLTEEQIKHLADMYCHDSYGFEGAETFPNCGKCLICLCKMKGVD